MPKMLATLYYTQPVLINEFLRLSDEDARAAAVHIAINCPDMTGTWTKVGTAEVELTWDLPGDLQSQAIAAMDKQIEAMSDEYIHRLNELKARRSELLCLEAPK